MEVCFIRLTPTLIIAPNPLTSKCSKLNFFKENYLISLPPALWIPLCKFRCRNHKLPVEKFRGQKFKILHLCHIHEVGDEFHYVLKCPFFAEQSRPILLLGKRIFTHPSIFILIML